MDNMNAMVKICNNEYKDFLDLPNVNGIAIGHKIVNGEDTGKLCLQVMVVKKLAKDEMVEEHLVPKEYKGFVTDVVEVGEITAFSNTGKIRPVIGGYSIGLAGSVFAGTYGCMVSTGAGSHLQKFILSNNHVIAGENAAAIGSLILQPAQGDGGANPGDGIANLSQFVPINFSGGNNTVDAAIGKIIDISQVSSSIAVIGNVVGIASAVIGGAVQKSGRTTGYTTGTIQAVNGTLSVNYSGGNTAVFINQIIASAMSSPGDSGSVVLDNQNRVIGLLFAGSTTITGINDIRNVLTSFRARLV